MGSKALFKRETQFIKTKKSIGFFSTPFQVTTFELILTLQEGKNLAVSIRNWMANVFKSKQIVVVSAVRVLPSS